MYFRRTVFTHSEAVQQPQATESDKTLGTFLAAGDFFGTCSSYCEQPQATSKNVVCLGFLGTFFPCSSFRGMVVIFSKLFYCSSRRQQKLSKNFFVWFLGPCSEWRSEHIMFWRGLAGTCFSTISEVTLWCFPVRQVIFSKLFYGSSRRQQKLSLDFRSIDFFGVVSELARPSERWFFSKLFYCSSRRQQKLSKKVVFRFSEVTLGSFLAWFRRLARPSEAWCFRPAGDFFEAVLRQQPQATEAVE